MLAPPAELLMTEGTAEAPPQPVTTLYVGNLPPTVDEHTLVQTFRPFGHIPDVQVQSPLPDLLSGRIRVVFRRKQPS